MLSIAQLHTLESFEMSTGGREKVHGSEPPGGLAPTEVLAEKQLGRICSLGTLLSSGPGIQVAAKLLLFFHQATRICNTLTISDPFGPAWQFVRNFWAAR